MRPLAFRILRELTHERFTSGTVLAKKLEVSRGAISDALKDAESAGIDIFSVMARGYKLAEPLSLLDAMAIQKDLSGFAQQIRVEVADVIVSTNSALLQRVSGGDGERESHKICLVAEIQTAGRGRRGRSWQSAFGSSLTFSLLWRFNCGVAGLAGLSLAVGLALVQALREAGVKKAMVKWPNDIMVNGMKLAGILIETQGDTLGPTSAVIGIGLNYRLPPALHAAIDQAACDFQSVSTERMPRNALLARLLSHLADILVRFEREGFAALRGEWLAVHALQGRRVHVIESDGSRIDATVKDVTAQGLLLVVCKNRERQLHSAEISLRV